MQDKWMLIETGGKLYLYATDIIERKEAGRRSHYTSPAETARPLSKKDCLMLAKSLLQHA